MYGPKFLPLNQSQSYNPEQYNTIEDSFCLPQVYWIVLLRFKQKTAVDN